MTWAGGLARLWSTGLVLEGLEVAAGFAASQPEIVPEVVLEFVAEIASASAASAAEAGGPARSDA